MMNRCVVFAIYRLNRYKRGDMFAVESKDKCERRYFVLVSIGLVG